MRIVRRECGETVLVEEIDIVEVGAVGEGVLSDDNVVFIRIDFPRYGNQSAG